MTNDQDRRNLTETHKGAVVRACVQCARSENWDLSRPLLESEIATNTRAMIVHAHHAGEYSARGYEILSGGPLHATHSGLLFICPHLAAEA